MHIFLKQIYIMLFIANVCTVYVIWLLYFYFLVLYIYMCVCVCVCVLLIIIIYFIFNNITGIMLDH